MRDAVARLYPSFADNPDYTSIVNERHHARLTALVDDARANGARIVPLGPPDEFAGAGQRASSRRALVVGVTDTMAIMQEEIFGPLLPIETYATLDDAIARINARPHPLAFYYFGATRRASRRVLRETLAGGVTVNDTLWHFAHEDLPFGGVGASGIGAYHGERELPDVHAREGGVRQPRVAAAKLLYPPYGPRFEKVLALLKRL